jgi:hypothetical protein
VTAPAFSIVVPAYNAAATLPATLASIRAQQDPDHEVIVVDDGSADDTGDVAERLGATLVRQANSGPAAARNNGVRAARGRWLAFVDADDWLMPSYLVRMRGLLESRPGVGLAYCDAWSYDEASGRVHRRSAMGPYRPAVPPTDPEAFFLALLRTNFVYVAAAAPRAVIEDLGGFDESLLGTEDWQMWMRIAAAGHRPAGTGDRLGVYRRRAGQLSGDQQRMLTGQVAAIRSLRGAVPPAFDAAVRERELQAERDLARARPAAGRGVLRTVLAPAITMRNFHRRVPPEVAEVLSLDPPIIVDESVP